jgi:monovalent cation:proton antiporter-2 (CPA2) family protein
MTPLGQAALFLAAAVICVPLSRRLGLGSVLGYLGAGMVIGPQLLDLVGDVDSILHFAEYGVVLLLFIIGLELQPSRLWVLRKSVFGQGSAQVILTGLLLAMAALACGLAPLPALIAGFGLALSSTAFALQILAERKQLTAQHGRTAFSILLFQDLAIIPMLAALAVWTPAPTGQPDTPVLVGLLKAVIALSAVIISGRYLLRPILRVVAATRIHELFTAMALLVLVATSLLMEFAGLSLALGAFLAGVLLADSEYRHELEADIEPFKGLLLGLFFMAVGASVNLGLLAAQPVPVISLVAGLLLAKAAVLYMLARVGGLQKDAPRQLAIVLSQGGEFAFVIFTAAVAAQLMAREVADLLVLVVSLSMVTTPLLLMLNDRVLTPWLKSREDSAPFDTIDDAGNPVIIAGFGRVGQIIARILTAKKIGFTALESNADQVDFVRRFGNKTYYGDPARIELLRAAKAGEAKLFVLAIEDVEHSMQTARTVRRHFPDLKIIARARNRQHVYKLMDLGITVINRDTYLSSLDMARKALAVLGQSQDDANRAVERFREHDEALLQRNYAHHDDEAKLADLAKLAARELEDLFEQDAREVGNR